MTPAGIPFLIMNITTTSIWDSNSISIHRLHVTYRVVERYRNHAKET